MQNYPPLAPAAFAAIDLETAGDPEATTLATRHGGAVSRNVALHRIRAAGWIVMTEDADGAWTVDEIASQDDLGDTEEFDILMSLNRVFRTVVDRTGELVTYNGLRHDMVVIRRRATRNWMFELDGLFPLLPIRHRDVMRVPGTNLGEWPKLREACAGLGFSCDHDYDCLGSGHSISPRRRKAETDAVATILIRLHELAAERRDAGTLTRSWSALVTHISQMRPSRPHLLQFCDSPELEAALNHATQA